VVFKLKKDCVGEDDVEMCKEAKQYVHITIHHITKVDFRFHPFSFFYLSITAL
jgi:hypothetical protein